MREDFEIGLKNLFDQNQGTKLMTLQSSMARYFFNFQPSLDSVYRRLAERLKSTEEEGVISTLNYERLLNLTLQSEHVPYFDRVGASHTNSPCLVLYPHGCSDLIVGGGNSSFGNVTDNPNLFKIDGPVRRADEATFTNVMATNDIPMCVMSYFVASKDSPTGQDFIKKQRDEYSGFCEKVDQIAVVGVRVREHDAHIWEPLEKTTAPIMYCSGMEAGEEYREWAERHGRNGDEVSEEYFEAAFDQIIAHIGI